MKTLMDQAEGFLIVIVRYLVLLVNVTHVSHFGHSQQPGWDYSVEKGVILLMEER